MKTAVITGVSTGIGKACAEYLMQNDFQVYGSVRKTKDAEYLISKYPHEFRPLIFDVCDEAAIQKAADFVLEDLGGKGLKVLINNAGIAINGPIVHVPIDQVKKQFEVNFFGVMRVSNAFLRHLGGFKNCPYPAGKIINISSMSGLMTNPFLGPYSASKFALESLTHSYRRELNIYGIDAITINPGPITSEIWSKARKEAPAFMDTDYKIFLKHKDKSIDQNEKNAIPAEAVAKLIYKCIHQSKAPTRNIIAKGDWLLKLIVRFMPDRWYDKLLVKEMKKITKQG